MAESTALQPQRRSAIEDAAHCLFRYKRLWIDGAPDKSDFSMRGIGYHVVKYHYVRRLVERGIPSDLDEAAIAFQTGIAEAKTPPHLVEEVRRLFDKHCEWFQVDLDRFLTAEERQHSEDGSWAADLVYASNDELEIVDDKTYYVSLTEAQIRTLFQVRFYISKAMQRWTGFKRYKFTMNWVRLGFSTSVVVEREDVATLDREVQAVLAAIVEAMKTNDWPAHAGPQCGYCALECPIEARSVNVPIRIQSPADAEAMAAMIVVSDSRNKLRKKTLKRWALVNGRVDLQGLVFDHRPVESVTYPIDKVMDVLEARGIDPGFTVSQSTLKKLLKSKPGLELDLAMYETRKIKHIFAAKKNVPDATDRGDDHEDDDDE